MLFQVTAEVEGEFALVSDLQVPVDDLVVDLLATNGRLTSIRISTHVKAEDFATGFASGLRIVINARSDVLDRLTRYLQTMESNLAFASVGGLARVRWDQLKERRIPETLDEQRFVSFPGIDFTDFYEPLRRELTNSETESLVRASSNFDNLVIPKAFWREALAELIGLRFIQAFQGFYYVLEGLFANGKSASKEVIKAFSRSDVLTTVTARVIPTHLNDDSYGSQLRGFYESQGCSTDVPGTYKLLVEMRGHLHHFQQRSKKPQPTPFDQTKYESLANLASDLATTSIRALESL